MENLYQEAKQHFNEPILIGLNLCRCIGYAEDEEDCYMITIQPRRGIVWHSFVGGYVYLDNLKGCQAIKSLQTGDVWDDFTRLDTLLELNGAPKATEFINESKEVSL